MYWRLSLDVPYDFATEPGLYKAQHCRDFRAVGDVVSSTWLDPTTGLLMLRPNNLDREYYANARPLSDHTVTSSFWRQSKRSADLTSAFTNVLGAGVAATGIEILVDVAIVAIEASLGLYDTLKWAIRSTYSLADDEGWCVHFNAIDDHLIRKKNWMILQWDNIGIHLSQTGTARVYRYDRDSLGTAPTLTHTFEFSTAGELAGRDGYIMLLPIPGVGLLFHTSTRSPRINSMLSSASSYSQHGHLIPWDSEEVIPEGGDAYLRMFRSSPITIGINPYQKYELMLQQVRFPANGDFTDAPFDPGYTPSADPIGILGVPIETLEQTVIATLRKADNSAAWVAGTDHKARVKLALSSSDSIHTPFVEGWALQWNPVLTTRNTVSVSTAGKVLELEITDNIRAEIEGVATVRMDTDDLRAIAERGDTTWMLENSADGITYATVAAGLAKDMESETHVDVSGTWYETRMSLVGMHERLRETHSHVQTAFDSVTPGDAVNMVLVSCGFSPITIPAGMPTRPIPGGGDTNSWRYAVREGDDGYELINKALVFGRTQHHQWILRWDAAAWDWVLEERARDTGTVTDLSPYSADYWAGTNPRYGAFRPTPQPPECNVALICGADRPDQHGTALTVLATNSASISDSSSLDYLGRVKMARYQCDEISDPGDLMHMARRIEALAMHRSLTGTIDIPEYDSTLAPNALVSPLRDDSTSPGDLWIKRRTITIRPGGLNGYDEVMVLEVDSIWEDDLP